jgi:predicted metalloprotease with PDZ domain
VKILSLLVALTLALPALAQKPRPLTLTVDATDAQRRILHVKESVPAEPGALTLRYPKWIPGEHGPTGPISDVAGIEVRAGGKPVDWTRDDVDLYAFHVTVPPGVHAVDVSFDYLGPGEREGYSAGGSMTPSLVALEWNLVVLYPDGVSQRAITVAPKLLLPRGWKFGTALDVAKQSDGSVEFKPVTLETLVDSPVAAGQHFRTLPLGGTPEHALDIVADSPQALEIEPQTLDSLKKLVTQAGLLFGTRHYGKYHFLLVLSDKVAHFGLEHHQSSDNRSRERSLIDATQRNLMSGLLPHEFVHSWNGKFRRPAGLAVDGFDKPMKDELLWVYEGLTNYLGFVLAGRAGTAANDWVKDELAATAAMMEYRSGRAWRPLEDTTMSAAMAQGRGQQEWVSWKRSLDYYPEGTLLWLEADVLIRQKSNGKKSLDDFCKIFHGGANSGPEVKPYTLDDVVAALNQVLPYDWAGFFKARIYQVAPHAPLGGLTSGGWKLVFNDKHNVRLSAIAKEDHTETYSYSLGFTLRAGERGGDAAVSDVLQGSPAFKAGIGPSMKLIGVDGRKLGKESLDDAIKLHATDKTPIELLLTNGDFYRVVKVDYHGGAKFPHLERDPAKPDLLEAILKPQ